MSTIIDESALDKLRSLSQSHQTDFAVEIIGDFLKSTPLKLTEIKKCLMTGDLKTVYEQAHSVKSVAAAVGAILLAKSAADLEAAALAGVMVRAHSGYADLLSSYETTRIALEAYCTKAAS